MKKKGLFTIGEIKKMIEQGLELGPDVPPALVKDVCSMLSELHKNHLAKTAVPEVPCPWRQSDELQKVRLSMPEPTRSDCQRMRYILQSDLPNPAHWSMDGKIPYPSDTIPTRTMETKMFRTPDGSKFLAWTADGENPLFPIPL